MEPSAYESRFFSAADGLRLHMRDYRPHRSGPLLPVVCLPGMARTSGDFDRLARRLVADPLRPRRVYALDYRGRGLSERDPDPSHYDLKVENADIGDVLTAAGIGEALFIGTSRGGLHILRLAGARPSVLRGAVLNDVGPVLEKRGLARIRGYVGKMPRPASWQEAVSIAKRITGGGFSGLSEADWETYARLTYEEKDGLLLTCYDPALSRVLDALDLEAPLPDMWPQFEALSDIPLLVIRGANSDLLSADTFAEMARRHPACETYVVEAQGHAPMLFDDASIARIGAFFDRSDPGVD